MKVNLKRGFYDNDRFYDSRDNPVEIPGRLKGSLPSDAVIVEEDPVPVAEEEPDNPDDPKPEEGKGAKAK